MDTGARRIPIGRVRGHRGAGGEITVIVASGEASFWVDLARVALDEATRPSVFYTVDAARAYRDRLVLKLRGIDDPSSAATLRGRAVHASVEDAQHAARERFHPALFLGLDAVDEAGRRVGRVVAVWPTRGNDLLVLQPGAPDDARDREILLPAVPQFLGVVNESAGTVTVHPPQGLYALEAPEAESE